MTPYTEQTTEALIADLFKAEDRVTLEHIRALASRADAVEPLRAILRNQLYWEEGQDGEFWIELHAVAILCMARAEAAIPDLISALELSGLHDMDWLYECFAGHLSQFGAVIVTPLIQFIRAIRDKYEDNFEYSFVRLEAAETLMRIGLAHPACRKEVVDFLCECLSDPTENDATFNTMMSDQLVYLDRDRTVEAVKAAYERDSIDETLTGDFDDFLKGIDQYEDMRMGELTSDPLEFYQPDEIASRQKRWKQEEAKEAQRLVAGSGPASLTRLIAEGEYGNAEEDWEVEQTTPVMPQGYNKAASGAAVRTEHTGRNDPCPCGSGKKFKKCCGK